MSSGSSYGMNDLLNNLKTKESEEFGHKSEGKAGLKTFRIVCFLN